MSPARRTGMLNVLMLAAAALSLGLSLACWHLYFTLYWPYRTVFDESGRYFDGQDGVVYHAHSALWAWPAAALTLLAILLGSYRRVFRSRSALAVSNNNHL